MTPPQYKQAVKPSQTTHHHKQSYNPLPHHTTTHRSLHHRGRYKGTGNEDSAIKSRQHFATPDTLSPA
ncbi:hypothetical protein E2C01_101484 [Portunus trituberculatus]|uniref:Uncharacterized protein n=1 Tax=Portunus trituberculatus TaxID=210409 RepID=A0A5B7KFV8_PORTR|nr:hypothetical protein [Portunus trituberculatus]